jgi:hypothetical protein
MPNLQNPMTDALKLVRQDTIHRTGWFTSPTINAEEGFLLEHYPIEKNQFLFEMKKEQMLTISQAQKQCALLLNVWRIR